MQTKRLSAIDNAKSINSSYRTKKVVIAEATSDNSQNQSQVSFDLGSTPRHLDFPKDIFQVTALDHDP